MHTVDVDDDVLMTGFDYRFLMQGCEALKARISKWQPLFLPHEAENYSSAIKWWDWKYSVLMKNTYDVLFWSSYTLRSALRRPCMSAIHTNYPHNLLTSRSLQLSPADGLQMLSLFISDADGLIGRAVSVSSRGQFSLNGF